MPDLNPEYVQFQKEIEAMIKELLTTLKRGNFSQMELAQLSAEINFFEEIKKLGYEQTVNKYFAGYENILSEVLDQAKDSGVDFFGINTDLLEMVQELDEEFLLGKAQAWNAQFKSEFIKSIIRGDSSTQTILNLREVPLTDAQLGVVLNTSRFDFKRMSIRETYKNKPDQRFTYEGGLIPTSSDECRHLVNEQDPKGYTMAEIDAGIETPYTYPEYPSLGELAGTVKKIYWGGRKPNYNCGHVWKPIGRFASIIEREKARVIAEREEREKKK